MPETSVQLHIQRFADFDTDRCAQLAGYLTTADLPRLARHPELRQRQILARGLLRELLGKAANCAPASLEFARDANGKPFLLNAGISFNSSHSNAACAIAWSPGELQLGVDIEDIDRDLNEAKLAAHAFSPGEIRAWQSASNKRQHWLYTWTRKEALLKATGLGIRISLASVDTETGDPPGCFSHGRLGALQYRSWIATEQVFSLAWVQRAGIDVGVSITGTLPGFEPVAG